MLEARLHQLEDAFNTNTKIFSDGFKMVELQLEIARRVAQQLLSLHPNELDRSRCRVMLDGITIDWNAYLKERIEELESSEKKAEDEKANGHVLSTPDDESPIIFGGGP